MKCIHFLCTFDSAQDQEYFKSMLDKIEQNLLVVEKDKRCAAYCSQLVMIVLLVLAL